MLLKIAVLAFAAFMAWRTIARAASTILGRPDEPRRGEPGSLEPMRCARCGVYRLRGRPCNCDDSTSG